MDDASGRRQPPGLFAFLGHGALLPARNLGLFLPLLAVAVLVDAAGISRADPASPAYRHIMRHLLGYSAIKMAAVSKAVAAFTGEGQRATTLDEALWNANAWGPLLTFAFVCVLELACAGGILAMALLAVVLLDYSLLLFLDALLVLLASLFLVYLTVVCAVAVVVSEAEPGRHGAGAVSRAWRLMRGRGSQAALYVVSTCALGAAVSPEYTLAVRWWPRSAAGGVAARVGYVLLLGAVEVFAAAAITAFYFECRESTDEEEEIMAGQRYNKLPNGDEANI